MTDNRCGTQSSVGMAFFFFFTSVFATLLFLWANGKRRDLEFKLRFAGRSRRIRREVAGKVLHKLVPLATTYKFEVQQWYDHWKLLTVAKRDGRWFAQATRRAHEERAASAGRSTTPQPQNRGGAKQTGYVPTSTTPRTGDHGASPRVTRQATGSAAGGGYQPVIKQLDEPRSPPPLQESPIVEPEANGRGGHPWTSDPLPMSPLSQFHQQRSQNQYSGGSVDSPRNPIGSTLATTNSRSSNGPGSVYSAPVGGTGTRYGATPSSSASARGAPPLFAVNSPAQGSGQYSSARYPYAS